jgi:hypothetical protein
MAELVGVDFGSDLFAHKDALQTQEPVPHHVVGDRCLRDVDAEFTQLAVNASCTPTWVGGADASNQLPHLGRYRWTTMARTTSPTPIEPKAFSVPGDHGLRFYDAKHRFPVWPNTRGPNPEKTIGGRQLVSPFLVPALENKKLMAQGEDSAWSAARVRSESRRVARKKAKTGNITRAYCHIALSAISSARTSFW